MSKVRICRLADAGEGAGLGAVSVLLLTREISKIAKEAIGDLKEE